MRITLAGGHQLLIDEEDAKLLEGRTWLYRPTSGGKGRLSYVSARTYGYLFLHRLITSAPAGMLVDHINGDRLDNRRSNLRLVTHSQNMRNAGLRTRLGKRSSRFKGVNRTKNGRWTARINTDAGPKYLGVFRSDVEAAYVYDVANIQSHGEFGRRNFLPFC